MTQKRLEFMSENHTTERSTGDYTVGSDSTVPSSRFIEPEIQRHSVIVAPTRTGMSFAKEAPEKHDD